MYRSKFKDRNEAQAYYIDMVNKGKCTPKFKEHYASIIANIPYAKATVEIIKPVNLPMCTAIPFTESEAKPNEIILGDGMVFI